MGTAIRITLGKISQIGFLVHSSTYVYTRTPYIVWGKGLRGPLADTGFSSHDAYSEGWEFRSSSNELLYRRDIDQADLAPLMTALLGINWPVNSVGVVPVDLLNPFEINGVASKVRGDGNKQDGEWFKAQVKFVNAKVILEQYRVKHGLFCVFYSYCFAIDKC